MKTFPISFDRPSRVLLGALGSGPAHSVVEVDNLEVRVRLGWSFRTVIPRATIAGVGRLDKRVISRGAHGWRGDWLVNGAGTGLVRIELEPRVRATVLAVPVRVRVLTVSVEDPDALVQALEAVRVDV